MTDNSDSDSEEVSQLTTRQLTTPSSMRWRPIDNMGRGAQIPLIRPTPVRPSIPVTQRTPQPPRSPPRTRRRINIYDYKPKRKPGGRRKRRKKKRTRKKRKKRTRRRKRKKGKKTKKRRIRGIVRR